MFSQLNTKMDAQEDLERLRQENERLRAENEALKRQQREYAELTPSSPDVVGFIPPESDARFDTKAKEHSRKRNARGVSLLCRTRCGLLSSVLCGVRNCAGDTTVVVQAPARFRLLTVAKQLDSEREQKLVHPV